MKNRIKYIDISRAFAIIFIVLGHTIVHSQHCNLIFKFLYSFHVVLFFIISGYTFKVKENEKSLPFIKKKFIRIIIPYFVWCILFLIPYIILGNGVGNSLGTTSSFNLKTQLLNVIYGVGNNAALKQNSALWFLPALFSMEVFCFFLIKYKKKYRINNIILVLSLIILSYITNTFSNFILPWGLNSVLVLNIYFYLGYLFKEKNYFTKERVFQAKYIVPIAIVGIIACFINSQTVSCIDYEYGNLLLCFLSGAGLSLLVIYLSYKINKNKTLEYIGKNTMGILIFHKLIILVFQTKMGIISELLSNSNLYIELILSLTITMLSIVLSLLATIIVRKMFPLLIGENKK